MLPGGKLLEAAWRPGKRSYKKRKLSTDLFVFTAVMLVLK